MSRYEFPAKLVNCTVAIGWDNPLVTFFTTVIRVAEGDEEDDVLLWLGTSPSEIKTPEQLTGPLAPYFDLTADIVAALKADRVAQLDRAPSPHQRAAHRLISDLRHQAGEKG